MVRIGIPRETKPGERRIVFIPDHVALLVRDGHEVRVASGAGSAIGKSDASYRDAGARVTTPDEAWDAELIVKVKEIQGAEYPHLRAGQALFGYHHLPREPERARPRREGRHRDRVRDGARLHRRLSAAGAHVRHRGTHGDHHRRETPGPSAAQRAGAGCRPSGAPSPTRSPPAWSHGHRSSPPEPPSPIRPA